MSIPQQELHTQLLAHLKKSGGLYQKYQPIHARVASGEEVIATVVDSKLETSNTAHKGDYIAVNLTASKEQYVIPKAKFSSLYRFSKSIDSTWNEYLPKGSIQAIEVTQALVLLLGEESPFQIEAPWGEIQHVEIGDYLGVPFPKLDEVYKIARSAFKETYRLLE